MTDTMLIPLRHIALPLILMSTAPLLAQDSERSEAYDAMLGCAAFHTIEASRAVQTDAADAQLAIAYDFAEVAAGLFPDGLVITANNDLKQRLIDYRTKLDTGDVREVAEDWTTLESACRELYPLRGAIGKALGTTEPTTDGR